MCRSFSTASETVVAPALTCSNSSFNRSASIPTRMLTSSPARGREKSAAPTRDRFDGMSRFWRKLRLTLEMIKFEHSVFALPFALTGALLAWRDANFEIPDLRYRLMWIVVAMVAARSAAMTFNRLLDADIDSRNQRTANRHLPS